MRKFFLLITLILLSTLASAQYTYQIVARNLVAPSSVTSANIIGSGAAFHNLTWNVSGTVSTCSVRVDSSVDGITWSTGDIIGATTCTSNGNSLSSSHIVNYVRINLVTFTGTNPVFTANVSGFIIQPSGGGTVTSVTCGTGLSGGTITSTGTCALTTPVAVANGGTGSTTGFTSAGVVGLFSPCSGTQSLGADGACHTASAGGGPVIDYTHCNNLLSASATTITCNSVKNLTIGDDIYMFCAGFTSDGGTITVLASDSINSNYTSLFTHFGTTTGERFTIAHKVATSSGAATFTCTYSATTTFRHIVVFKITGANATPTDVTATNEQGSTNVNQFSGVLTTTSDNDLAFMYEGCNLSDSSTFTTTFTMSFTVYNIGSSAGCFYIMAKKLGKAGDYTLQAISSTATYSNIAIALKQ